MIALIISILGFLGPFIPVALRFLDDKYKNGELTVEQAKRFIELAEKAAEDGFELPAQLRESSLDQKQKLSEYAAKLDAKKEVKNENI